MFYVLLKIKLLVCFTKLIDRLHDNKKEFSEIC